MDKPQSRLRRMRSRILGGLALPLFLPLGVGDVAAQTPNVSGSAELTAPASAPALKLADCLRIAAEQQPALAAQRASLAAAQTAVQGLDKLHVPNFLAR